MKEFELIDEKERGKKGYTNSGVIEIVSIQVAKGEGTSSVASGKEITEKIKKISPDDMIKYLRMSPSSGSSLFRFRIKGNNLEKKDTFNQSDPFLVIYRLTSGGQKLKVHETEVHENEPNPQFQTFTLSVSDLFGGNLQEGVMLVECFDHNGTLANELIGSFKVLSTKHKYFKLISIE